MSVVTMLATAGAVYGGIKADLKAMHVRIEAHTSEINLRLDGVMDQVRYQREQIDKLKEH